jgi:hypothetical protein
VLGQFKTIVIMLSGYLIFRSDPGVTSICGAIVALGGMSFYTYLGMKESTAPTGRSNSFLGKPGVVGDGGSSDYEDSV